MDPEASVCNPLERMLIDDTAEPTNLQLPLLKSITNNFSDDLQIGTGGFAVVYKGLLQNGTVAVKKLTQTFDMHETKFHQEVDSLMRVRHKNIVRFMGYCSDTQGKVWKLRGRNVMVEERQRFLCFEFLPKGSLDKYISDAAQGLEWMTRYQIIKGICEGLHYLHQQKIVHLDLKPANILLDNYMVPKIADFGLSKSFDEKQTRAMTLNVFGSLGYMAPEYHGGLITFKSDIYSLGVIIIEILTGLKGYPQIENVLGSWGTRFETSLEDTRLEHVRECTEIGIECTEFNPDKRPDTHRIIEKLAEMERKYVFMKTDVFAFSSATNHCTSEAGSNDKVTLQTMARTKSIPSTTGANRFAVLVRVTAPLRCIESSRAGLDLVAVLDFSGSTSVGNMMESMKQAMIFVIDNLGPDDRLSVVSFIGRLRRCMGLSIMSDLNRKRARHVVRSLPERVLLGHSHDAGAAIKEAAEILRRRGSEERSNRLGRIILLSGGEDIIYNDDSPEFPVETFGLGAYHDPNALRYIADKTMGVYSYVNQDLEKIKGAFAQSLGGLMSVTAMDVQVNLQTLDGVTISSIESGSYLTSISSDKRSGTIHVQDLYEGEQKNFIVYLKVAEGEQNIWLMNVSGSYRNPKISKEAIQLDDSQVAVLRPKVATTPSDETVCPDVAAELLRLQLIKYVSFMVERRITSDELQVLWEVIKFSEHGRSAPQSAVLALDGDVAEMKDKEANPFMCSWLTSHGLQRATTKGSPLKSFAFRVKAMEEMIKKVDAEPKRLPESTGRDDKVKLETMARIKSIPSTTGANHFPVLVRVTAPMRCTESSRARLDLVAVLDVSGSMSAENRLGSMKKTMEFVIDHLGQDDRLSIVSFNRKPIWLTELSVMSDANRGIARAEVNKLQAGGGTDMVKALQMAATILEQRKQEEKCSRVGRIIFLTDGEDDSVFNKNINSEFTVETFGLGDSHDPRVLRYIADKTRGVYSYVNQGLDSEIQEALAQSIGRLTSIIAMGLQINLQTHASITISSIESGGYQASVSTYGRSGTIEIDDLYAGEQKNFIVYLTVPESKERELLTVSGSYKNTRINKEADILQLDAGQVIVRRPEAAAALAEDVCPEVAAELVRLRLMKAITTMVENPAIYKLQRFWDEIKGSEDGRRAATPTMSDLAKDVEAMIDNKGKGGEATAFMLSWVTSHLWQRATYKSPAFQVKLIPSTTRHNRFPVLVRVTAPLRHTESLRAALDLVAVLDVSGSMCRDNRMESMKQAMIFVINNLGPDDRLSVVSFNNVPQRHTELSIMSEVNREVARKKVLELVPGGEDDMGAAIKEAAEILRQRGPEERNNRVGRIIFLSDGLNMEIFNHHISPEFPAETFGLGADHDPNVLRYIADKTMGVYSYVNQNLEKIKDAFAQSLGSLMSVTAMDVQVNLQTLDGVTISSIESGNYPKSISSDKRSGTIYVPDLYAGEQKNFIVYVTVPKGEQNQLVTVSGSYRNPNISKEATIQLDDSELAVLLPKVATNPSDETVCPDVAAGLFRLQLARYVLTTKIDILHKLRKFC